MARSRGNTFITRLASPLFRFCSRLTGRIRGRVERFRMGRYLTSQRLQKEALEVRELLESLRRSGCQTLDSERESLTTRLNGVDELCRSRTFSGLSLEERMDVHRFILHTRSRLLHSASGSSPPTQRVQ